MNKYDKKNLIEKFKFKFRYYSRIFEIPYNLNSFSNKKPNVIGRIYTLNLDRKPKRWNQMKRELSRVGIGEGKTLLDITRRFSAVDARYLPPEESSKELLRLYTLADQLAVEPTDKLISNIDPDTIQIEMTQQEVAIALSHIGMWKLISESQNDFTLILEDDVYFTFNFSRKFDFIWQQIDKEINGEFDILFLSYDYVKNFKETEQLMNEADFMRPNRGIWQASGYILSRKGAVKLLELLPVRGPVDLWLNLVFDNLDVYIVRKPMIVQRFDVPSSNSYSIMPIFSKLGIYNNNNNGNSDYMYSKLKSPVFVFGENGSKSIAVALMILGYACYYNLDRLPDYDVEILFKGNKKEIHFDAYVNIKSLTLVGADVVRSIYPSSMIIILEDYNYYFKEKRADNVLFFQNDSVDKWQDLVTFLGAEYPAHPFPNFVNNPMYTIKCVERRKFNAKELDFDDLPWIISDLKDLNIFVDEDKVNFRRLEEFDVYNQLCFSNWIFRNDTFPGNLALFQSENVNVKNGVGIDLTFKKEMTEVREYTSGSIVSKSEYLYGRFIAEICPPKVSGLITGIFLHRNSPHQEIDIEITGNDTTKMLVNVFFNPGIQSTKLEYGYRGTPVAVDLGFDASEKFHVYEIRWTESSIKWFVDDKLVYERGLFSPTPIPHAQMEFNINLWNSHSEELAGSLEEKNLPATTQIRRITIEEITM